MIKYSAVLLIFISGFLVDANAVTWEKLYVKKSTDCFRCVREVPAGGYVLAGYTANFTPNDTDGIVLRMDANGDTLWTFVYNGPSSKEDLFYKVAPTSDGGFIVAGYSKSFGNGDNVVYLKLNSNGQLQWIKNWGGSGAEHTEDIIELSDGSFAICGYSTSAPAHYYDAFLLKVDASGNTLWNKLYGGVNYDDANSILELADGGFLMGGQSNSQFSLIRVKSNGDTLWTKTFGTTGADNIECINFAQGGNGYILAGTTDGIGNGGEDAYLALTDTGGIILWAKTYGGSLNDGIHRIEQTTDGGYVGVGTSDQAPMTNPNCWLVKFDVSGNLSWQNFFGGNDHDHGYSGQQTSDGGYILTGHTHSYLSNSNNEDGIIERTNSTGQVTNKMIWTTVKTLLSPVVTTCGSSTAQIKVELANYGNTTVTSIPVTVEITGAITQTLTQTYSSSLTRNSSTTLTFTTTVDMSGGGTFNFHCYTGNPHDIIPAANYLDKSITVGGTSPPSVTNGSHCGPGAVTLSANSVTAIQWFSASSGGSSLGSGSSFVTPYLTSTTTYYAQSGGSCQSARVPVDAIVAPGLAVPVAVDNSRCGQGVETISVTSPYTIKWYSSNSSTTSLGTGLSFVTPSISSTTTYYAQAEDLNCTSVRTPVVANVLTPPANPVTTSGTHCGQGAVTLNATSPVSIVWYDASIGGNIVGNGPSYITPVISSNTTYYALADNGTCTSNRIAAVANIASPPADPVTVSASRCGPGTVQLTATAPATVKWYDAATGGNQVGTGLNFTTPSISATTSYYAVTDNGCVSNRVQTVATVNTLPTSPVTTAGNRCGTGTVTLSASASNQVKWFSAATGGSSLATGNSFTTPSISSTTTYYAAADDGCLSTRTPAVATINAIPSAPVATDGARCGSGTVTLSATASNTMTWFDAASGGNQVGSGGTFITPVLNSTTTYYISTANSNCTSARIAVVATIASTPAVPVVTSASRCGTGTVTLSATSSGTVNWFNTLSGGAPLSTGNSFTTPAISSTTTYYALTDNGCLSNRVPVVATVNTIPAAPVTTSADRCGDGTLVLSAASTNPVEWFDVPSGGSVIANGNSYTTPLLSVTTSYYARSNDGTCKSSRVQAVAIINALPLDPVVSPASVCGSGIIVLNAVSTDTLKWFDSTNVQVGSGSTFTTPLLLATTMYFVQASNAVCPGNNIPVSATVNALPVVDIGTDTIITSSLNYILDPGAGFSVYSWNTGETTQSITAITDAFYCVTVTDNNNCTGSDCTLLEFTVGINETPDNSFHLYPVPSNGMINIDQAVSGNDMMVLDLTGKIVFIKNQLSTHETFDFAFLNAGYYFVKILNGGRTYQTKMILQ